MRLQLINRQGVLWFFSSAVQHNQPVVKESKQSVMSSLILITGFRVLIAVKALSRTQQLLVMKQPTGRVSRSARPSNVSLFGQAHNGEQAANKSKKKKNKGLFLIVNGQREETSFSTPSLHAFDGGEGWGEEVSM